MSEIERLIDEMIVQSYMAGFTAGDEDQTIHTEARQRAKTYKMFVMAIIKEMHK